MGDVMMTKEFSKKRRNESGLRILICNLLLFLTGLCIGCLWSLLFGVAEPLSKESLLHELSGLHSFFFLLMQNSRGLMLLLLLSFAPCAALVVPLVFGLVGIRIGHFVTMLLTFEGTGLWLICLMCRLALLLPYSFLLGSWSVMQSLKEKITTHFISVFLVTMAVAAVTSGLELALRLAVSMI